MYSNYNSENPIEIDADSSFFDNKQIYFVHRSKTHASKNTFPKENFPHFFDSDKKQVTGKFNWFSSSTFNINLFVGLGSKYLNNNILNSDFYNKDTNYIKITKNLNKKDSFDNTILPFNDRIDYKGKVLDINFNPKIHYKTYGIDNPDALFEKISFEPFLDTGNIENTQDFFAMPSEIKYPRYFNHYSLSKLNSNLSIFGTIEEIDGSMLTERSIKGIKCELIKNSTDSRDRSLNITSKMTLLELEKDENNKSKYRIESYSDEEYTDLITGNDELLERSFAYTTKIINGSVHTVFDTRETTSSLVPRLSNKIIFYTEDDNNIAPFSDRDIIMLDSNQTSNNDYNTGDIYSSHGHDFDNSQGSGPDSMAFIGDQD